MFFVSYQCKFKTLKKGDIIASFNFETKAIEPDIVIDFFVHEDKEYELIEINDKLNVTPEHLVYTEDGWKKAGELTLDDVLLDSDGGEEKIESLDRVVEETEVYNLETKLNHNYFAEGLLVHNDKESVNYLLRIVNQKTTQLRENIENNKWEYIDKNIGDNTRLSLENLIELIEPTKMIENPLDLIGKFKKSQAIAIQQDPNYDPRTDLNNFIIRIISNQNLKDSQIQRLIENFEVQENSMDSSLEEIIDAHAFNILLHKRLEGVIELSDIFGEYKAALMEAQREYKDDTRNPIEIFRVFVHRTAEDIKYVDDVVKEDLPLVGKKLPISGQELSIRSRIFLEGMINEELKNTLGTKKLTRRDYSEVGHKQVFQNKFKGFGTSWTTSWEFVQKLKQKMNADGYDVTIVKTQVNANDPRVIDINYDYVRTITDPSQIPKPLVGETIDEEAEVVVNKPVIEYTIVE